MQMISNYELILSSLETENGPKPFVALSFNASALNSGELHSHLFPWKEEECGLRLSKEGFILTLRDQKYALPYSNSCSHDQAHELVQAYRSWFVCVFGDEGELIQSMGFEPF